MMETANTVNIDSFDARITATGMQDDPGGAALLCDGGAGPGIYTGSVEGQPQPTGFANRITINPDLFDDPSALVLYSSTTGVGDQTRPDALYARADRDGSAIQFSV